jgi:cytochrome c biogenesis protein CcdA
LTCVIQDANGSQTGLPTAKFAERIINMPLTFGILIGFLVIVIGAILLLATRYKKTAKVVIGVGLVITGLTFILIFLALNSQM